MTWRSFATSAARPALSRLPTGNVPITGREMVPVWETTYSPPSADHCSNAPFAGAHCTTDSLSFVCGANGGASENAGPDRASVRIAAGASLAMPAMTALEFFSDRIINAPHRSVVRVKTCNLSLSAQTPNAGNHMPNFCEHSVDLSRFEKLGLPIHSFEYRPIQAKFDYSRLPAHRSNGIGRPYLGWFGYRGWLRPSPLPRSRKYVRRDALPRLIQI